MEARPDEVKKSPSGVQATMAYKQNMKWLCPLFDYLQRKELEDDIVAGLWMIIRVFIILFE